MMLSVPQTLPHNTKCYDNSRGLRSECNLSEVLLGRTEENDEKPQSGELLSFRDLPNTNLVHLILCREVKKVNLTLEQPKSPRGALAV